MHRLMRNYDEPLIQRGSKESIFDITIHQLRLDGYDETKVSDTEYQYKKIMYKNDF